ncbi:hypothetical protein Tco_0885740 [Tanacetum coccineum]
MINTKKNTLVGIKDYGNKDLGWIRDEEDTSTQDTFWTSFVIEGVDNENTTPVNIEINDNIDNPYQEQDPINDPKPHQSNTITKHLQPSPKKKATTSFQRRTQGNNI